MSAQPFTPVRPRGPLSRWILSFPALEPMPEIRAADGFTDDLHLALYICYEGHFAGLDFLPDGFEWHPDVVAFRSRLETAFEQSLRSSADSSPQLALRKHLSAAEMIELLIAEDDGPSISRYMQSAGTLHEMAEFLMHRSSYQLKEADPHTIAIPHLRGRAKQILAEIQAGEYGADEPNRRMHSDLFAQTMRTFGLDDRPNAYLDRLPGSALMISNLISMLGFHRSRRGGLVGHLAVFEMTSVVPMGRYASGLDRMNAPDGARQFYEVHVLADAVHERLALEMVRCLETTEPALRDDIIFGAQSVLITERLFAEELFRSWGADRSPQARPAA